MLCEISYIRDNVKFDLRQLAVNVISSSNMTPRHPLQSHTLRRRRDRNACYWAAVHKMRPVNCYTDVARSVVCVSVCWSRTRMCPAKKRLNRSRYRLELTRVDQGKMY